MCSFYFIVHDPIRLTGYNATDTHILGYPEDRRNTLFRNIGMYLPIYISSHTGSRKLSLGIFWVGERLITVKEQVCCAVLLGRVCKLCRNTTDPPLAARTSSSPSTGLEGSWGLQEVEVHRMFRQLAHSGGKLIRPMHRPPLPPRKYSC
jgi:hypothetical protein